MISKYFPDIASNWPEFTNSILETIEMVVIVGIISLIISLGLAFILVVTQPNGIKPNPIIWNILDKIINLFRSIPFIILIVALIPLTTLVSGTAIGVKGTIFPLVVGITPFFTRQIESALNDIDPGLIETGQSIGLNNWQIVKAVYFHESLPSITRMTTTTIISLVGLTAIVGTVGGGGIGNFAIQYGYQQNQFDTTMACIIALLVIVTIFQIAGTLISEVLTH